MRRALLASTLALSCPLPLLAAAVDPDLLAGMKARHIGPATMSGRVAALAAVVRDPAVVYVGAATGGVWKSTDGALTWKPIFDDQPVAAIGAVAVFQPSPDIVWVGTGEGNPRNSASVGNGVYRSLDGGSTWTHLGLEESERIHRIVLHPADPDVAWVAAMGKTWGENPERGVFKTTDGGKSWDKVLYADERTGAADLVMDPGNPLKLFAALWEHRRWPWFFRSGGPGSGLYVTHDGGATWRRLSAEDGLPEGDLGRIGVAIAPSDPAIVYAFAEAEGDDNFILRSADGGKSWETVSRSADQAIGNRPFYYADLRVDPRDSNRLYSLWSRISLSEDGGRTWRVQVPFARAHPDHHALWIDPNDPDHLIGGNDGGVYVSRNRGETWRFVRNLPLAQLYHVRVDSATPYNVYFGLQDNGSWRGPSAVWENGGIRDFHWQELFFGDGFDTVPDPEDPDRGYAMGQQGYLGRWNAVTGERKSIRPAPPPGEDALRFNWNAGIALDPFEPGRLYYGSQYLHASPDRGETWETISPDLTTDNPDWQKQGESGGLTPDVTGAENFTSIVAIAPSPVAHGTLWVGTDDGRLHVTRDGGGEWTSVEENLSGVPANTWIPHVEPSRFDAAEAFVVLDDHRRSNQTPYVLKTEDYGASWKSLATPALRGYALAIAQDPVDRDLLFLGTEFGLWVSLDGGASWLPFRHGLPTVSVMDLVVHPRDHDLVVGTHGRGVFIVDDVGPLRGLSAEVLAEPLHLFPIPAAQQHRVRQTGSSRFPGQGEFRGENRPYGAQVSFSLSLPDLPHPDAETERRRQQEARRDGAQEPEDGKAPAEAEIRVADSEGALLRTFKSPVTLGLNRAAWDLRRDAFAEPPRPDRRGEPRGPEVLPGTYTVTVAVGEHEASAAVEVLADPRTAIPRADREARQSALLRAGALREAAAAAIESLHRTRDDLRTVAARLEDGEEDGLEAEDRAEDAPQEGAGAPEAPLVERIAAAASRVAALERLLWPPPQVKGYLPPTDAWSHIDDAYDFLDSSWDAPTTAQLEYLRRAEDALAGALDAVRRFFDEELPTLRAAVRARRIGLLAAGEPAGPKP